MMIKHRIIAAATMGMLLSGASCLAASESSGWYFGVTGGQAEVDVDKGDLDETVEDLFFFEGFPVTSASSDLDDNDVSWSLFGGYRFLPYLAVEASYIDLGTAKYRASGTVDPVGPTAPTTANYSTDLEAKGFTAAVVGTAPLGEMFEVHGKLGVLFADIDISEAASVTGFGSEGGGFSSDSRDLFYGVGAGMNIGEQWSLNLDWQRFADVGDEDETGEVDIDRISLGVIFRL